MESGSPSRTFGKMLAKAYLACKKMLCSGSLSGKLPHVGADGLVANRVAKVPRGGDFGTRGRNLLPSIAPHKRNEGIDHESIR